MDNKIILLTNRGIRENRTGVTLFKNKMTNFTHRLRCASVEAGSNYKGFKLALEDEGNEQDFIIESITSGNNNPWVFFIHGNNQTLEKNLKKCFKLKELYNVNVLAFSWPSVHHGKIRGFLNYIPRQPNIGMYATRKLRGKLKQYGKALINAQLSAPDLVNALEITSTAFSGVTNKLTFISHSLGNYVVELSNH